MNAVSLDYWNVVNFPLTAENVKWRPLTTKSDSYNLCVLGGGWGILELIP